MANQQSRGGKKQGTNNPNNSDQHQGVRADPQTNDNAGERSERDIERDRQNRDDPSRAPESGDRK
jgi:hypothetical protein